jgi:competence protein ComEC
VKKPPGGRATNNERSDHPVPSAWEWLDLRLALPAVSVWGSAAWATGLSLRTAVLATLALAAVGAGAGRLGHRLLAAVLLLAAAAVTVSALRVSGVAAGPVPGLAEERAEVDAQLVVTSDPVAKEGTFSSFVLLRARIELVTGRGVATRVRSPVLVIADVSWSSVRVGARLAAAGRLEPATETDLAGVLVTHGRPTVLQPPSPLERFVSRMRGGLRAAAGGLRPVERVLVPALVDGDDSGMPDQAVADFRTCGLTHLLAVSGSNLTLVLGFLMLMARWCRVRARGLTAVGALGVVLFVLLARAEPSVLRAAAMGVVALAGLSAPDLARGVRSLSVAVLVLVLVDPWLARSTGFLLSALATAAILLLAPAWRDAMAGWLPRWLAEALAVPMAAQLVCTPVVAALSGQVSMVAVAANLAAAPAVGPATVLGLLACVTSLANGWLAAGLARVAGLGAWWIVTVAEHGADLAGASLGWPIGAWGIAALTVACLAIMAVTPRVLRRRSASLAAVALLACWLVRPPSVLGWPPHDWIMVACDIGQGDGLVLNAGDGRGVVVDTGPDPQLMGGCLKGLGIESVPLVVLTHFHSDHVDGLPGVLAGRQVGMIEVGLLDEPHDQVVDVGRWAAHAGVPVRRVSYGERGTCGELRWTVIAPVPGFDPANSSEVALGGTDDSSGSPPNNASIVMMVTTRGVRLLLTGDIEPPAQQALLASGVDLHADVLKVPHHGSRFQDPDFISAVQASLAVVSVGADNDYGHPASETMAFLDGLGSVTYRTDEDGSIAVVGSAAGLAVQTQP